MQISEGKHTMDQRAVPIEPSSGLCLYDSMFLTFFTLVVYWLVKRMVALCKDFQLHILSLEMPQVCTI